MRMQLIKRKSRVIRRVAALCLSCILLVGNLVPAQGSSTVQAGAESKAAGATMLDFAQYDYTAVEISDAGWKYGSTTTNVSYSNGVISGNTGNISDSAVLTLAAGSAANKFTLEKDVTYRLSVTYKSAAKLMFFIGNWTAVGSSAEAAADWKTISVTYTATSSGTLPIYVQNWGGDNPTGAFQIKDMYIAKVSDAKTLNAGDAIGTLPTIDRMPSDSGHDIAWCVKDAKTGAYTRITEDTVYDKSMGTVIYAAEVRAAHGPNAHWWTKDGATALEHKCSECDATEEHTYAGDVCTVCGYDLSEAVQFAQYDYTTAAIGGKGWKVGSTTTGVSISDGVISGKTGDTEDANVLTLETSDGNNFTMEAGTKYRFSVTYKSAANLMFFIGDWIPVADAAAAVEWKTINVTFTANAEGKLPIYIQNWGGANPIGEFQIKDMYIAKVGDARILEDGKAIGTLPEMNQTPSDSGHEMAWCMKDQKTGAYTRITKDTVYDSKTMGKVIYAAEMLALHGPNAHWWTSKGATALVHKCSECDATEEHSYEGDVCTVCGYDLSEAVQFAQYDYTTAAIGGKGWKVGSTTTSVKISDGVISGKTGDTEDANVLTLETSDGNNFTMKAGTKYRFSVTYKSAANLMFFIGDWIPVADAAAAAEWKTINVTFTPDADGKLPIYIQNWGGENPKGKFQIKDMYISKISDAKVIKDGKKLGTLPKIDRTPSDSSHEIAWCVKDAKTGAYTEITKKTVYDSKTMGKVIYAAELLSSHGPNAHWWTKDGATALVHKCSQCDATEEHTYEGDVCTVCGYDLSKSVQFALYDYTTTVIGGKGWKVGSTTTGVKISDGVISGKTGDTKDANVLTLETSDANNFTLEAGTKYRFSVTYKSAANLMFFIGDWIPVADAAAAAEWKTINVTFTPNADGKLPIYIQNWGGENPKGQFQIKDMYISKISDARVIKDGKKIGTLPKIDRTPSDSSHEIAWCVKDAKTGAYTRVTEKTVYDSKTMGKVIYAAEVLAPHSSSAHWWTKKGATVAVHKCSECDATEEHTYVNDICTVCGYDLSEAVQFVLYDYTEVEITNGGWQVGADTEDVKCSDGVISGKTGAGAEVLSLNTGDENPYTLKAGVKYRLSLTYKSEAALMLFYGDWKNFMDEPTAAEEWKTVNATFTPDADGKLTIYIQNWESEKKSGEFQIKDICISRVSDARKLKDGKAIGTLPRIDRTPSDSSHEFAWCVKETKTGAYTRITADTAYNSKTMGKAIYAAEVLAPHSENSHWWTSEGATVTEHKCSVCGVTEEHTYVNDVCKVCGYDMSDALKFVLCNYTSVEIGENGWSVGDTTSNVTVADGVISGMTGATSSPEVLSLHAFSDMNPFTMEAGVKYRVSITYKSTADLMFFCDDWKSFTKQATSAADWKTIMVTITPDASRKLAVYVQNWGGENSIGEFQIKDIFISRVSDSRMPENGNPIGAFPEIPYEPSSEYNEFVWHMKNNDGSGYLSVTPETVYDSATMGTEIVAEEVKTYHSILNYVRYDMQNVDNWVTGTAMKAGSFSMEDGIIRGKVLSNTVGDTILSFTDSTNSLTLEPGIEYKVIMTYKSDATFAAFLNLKSNAWTEAPGKCLKSTGDEWKTVTVTFQAAAGDVFNGALIQSWNDGAEYSFQMKEFCIVRAEDTRKFAGNEALGTIPDCEGEDDALGRYEYEWVVYKENGEAVDLTGNESIRNITSAVNETGALYAYERIKCVYHMDDGKDYGKAPTCTEEGYSPYFVCKTCGKLFSDSLCKNEITDLEAWKTKEGRLEPTGHIHTTELLALDGNVYYYCECNKLFERDGDTYVEVPITLLDNVGERTEEKGETDKK